MQAGCIGGTQRGKSGADPTRSRSTCVPRCARHPPLQPRPSGSVRVLATTVQTSTGKPLSPPLYCTSIDHCCHAVDRRTSGCPHPVWNLDGARHSAYPNANFRVPHGEPATLGLKSNISRHHQTHNEQVPHEGPHLELSLCKRHVAPHRHCSFPRKPKRSLQRNRSRPTNTQKKLTKFAPLGSSNAPKTHPPGTPK